MTRSKPYSKKRGWWLNWLAASALAFGPAIPTTAAIYEYRDEQGRRVFVDSLSKVPAQYRDQLEVREEVSRTPQQRSEADRLTRIADLERALRNLDRLLARQASAIHAENNQILVPVRVVRGTRDQELRLLLDSGANRTVFHKDALASLGSMSAAVEQALTANGQAIDLYTLNLDRFELGPFEISPAQVQVIEYQGRAAHQGLLGMDILSQVDYDLDLEAGELRWAPEEFERLTARRSEIEARLIELRSPPSETPASAPSAPSADGTAE